MVLHSKINEQISWLGRGETYMGTEVRVAAWVSPCGARKLRRVIAGCLEELTSPSTVSCTRVGSPM